MFPHRKWVPDNNFYIVQNSYLRSENKQQQRQFLRYGSQSNNSLFGRQSRRKYWSGDQNQTRTIKSKYKQEQVFPQNTEQSSVPMAGKIKYLYQNWKVLTKDQWVCQVVQCTTLDFIQTPLPFWSTIFQLDQNRSSWPRNKIIVGERATKVVKDQKGFLI